ncbi:MAG: sugar ABC transporter permease [Actinobacteria bacterium]|nr:MAG: sugar ABC transporter permease [Actinomycetota bacterium]
MATTMATRHAATRPGNPRSRRPGATRRRTRQRLTILSFIAPALIGIVIFFVYPLISALYFSFTKFNLLTPPEFVGLRNYQNMFHDTNLIKASENTIWLVLVMVPAQVLFGLGTGILLVTMKRSATIYRTIFYLPALVPPVAGALAFVYVLKPGTGPVNALLANFGIEGPQWFNDPAWAKPSLTLLALWGIGNTMVIFLAALLDVPVSLHEAAALDGANAWQRFRHVTLPMLSPVIVFSTITGIITTLQFFTEAAVAASAASGQATNGGNSVSTLFGYPEGSTFTYPLWLYVKGFGYNQMGYASAMAIVLFVVAFAIILLVLKRSKSFSGEAS